MSDISSKFSKKIQKYINCQLSDWFAGLPNYIKVYLPNLSAKVEFIRYNKRIFGGMFRILRGLTASQLKPGKGSAQDPIRCFQKAPKHEITAVTIIIAHFGHIKKYEKRKPKG